MKYLFDTNIILYYLNGQLPQKVYEYITKLLSQSFFISTITKIELLGWHKIDETEEFKIREFLKFATIIYVNDEVEDLAIKYRRLKSIKLPDAIIAATASVYNLTLITRNKKDFKNLPINILNPFEI